MRWRIQGIRWTSRCWSVCCKCAFQLAEVEIYHEGKVYQQRYERGKVMEKLTVIGDCEEGKTGTKVTFLPDDTILRQRSLILMF